MHLNIPFDYLPLIDYVVQSQLNGYVLYSFTWFTCYFSFVEWLLFIHKHNIIKHSTCCNWEIKKMFNKPHIIMTVTCNKATPVLVSTRRMLQVFNSIQLFKERLHECNSN